MREDLKDLAVMNAVLGKKGNAEEEVADLMLKVEFIFHHTLQEQESFHEVEEMQQELDKWEQHEGEVDDAIQELNDMADEMVGGPKGHEVEGLMNDAMSLKRIIYLVNFSQK